MHRAIPLLGSLFLSIICGSGPLLAASLSKPLYVKKSDLPSTLLATRTELAKRFQGQRAMEKSIRWEPWHYNANPGVVASGNEPFNAKGKNGKPVWAIHKEWKDGRYLRYPKMAYTIARKFHAPKAGELFVGVGGGSRLKIFLNSKLVADLDTHLKYGRYGCAFNFDGERRDQFLVGLPVREGENVLTIQLENTITEPEFEPLAYGMPSRTGPDQFLNSTRRCYEGFCFTTVPIPTPSLWRQIGNDFPREKYQLLKLAPAEWFGWYWKNGCGWMAKNNNLHFEKTFLASAFKVLGKRGETLKQQQDTLEAAKVGANDPRRLDLCIRTAELQATVDKLDKTRLAIDALKTRFGDDYPAVAFLKELDDFEKRYLQAVAKEKPAQVLSDILAKMRHKMLVAENPFLKGQQLVFARRYTYDSPHYYDHFYHGYKRFGGNLCTYDIDTGKVTDLVPELNGGIFDRYDLSYDADKIVFGYRADKPQGTRIWEKNLDTGRLRQITFTPKDEDARIKRYSMKPQAFLDKYPTLFGHWTDDLHPIYGPDGKFYFASSRCERTAYCGGHRLPMTVLYRVNSDGTGMERLSQSPLSEFAPQFTSDGRIVYTRWEYVYKGIGGVQSLWGMRPDGTASEEIYGDNITNPGVFWQPRQIPERPNLFVYTACSHEPLGVGAIGMVDTNCNHTSYDAMTSLTPHVRTEGIRGLFQKRNGQWKAHDLYGPFYCDPFPLSDQFFLVACNPDKRYNDESGYNLAILDVFGNCIPIYDDAEMSCFQPILKAPRPKPPVFPQASQPGAIAQNIDESPSNESAPGHGTLMMTDVYQGLGDVPRGTVKYLRIMRQIHRPWSVFPSTDPRGGVPGQVIAVSRGTHIWVATLEGIVPVEADGSAYFTVPADANIFFQALDENYMEIQRMRTFINMRPGEKRSCIGCHDRKLGGMAVSPNHAPMALKHPPYDPMPQPGEVAPRPLHYEADVQPVFDKHCISCHNAEKKDGELDLSGTRTVMFNRSYEEILKKDLIQNLIEWVPAPGVKGNGSYYSMLNIEAVEPYTLGSHASRLVKILRDGHYDVALSENEWVRLVTWIDANAPYYGSYFGNRHISTLKQGEHLFRQLPSMASAYGFPKDPHEKADSAGGCKSCEAAENACNQK